MDDICGENGKREKTCYTGKKFFSVATCGRIVSRLASFTRFFRSSKKVLVLKNDGLGDLIIFLPYVAQIRNHYKSLGYETYLMVREPWKELAGKSNCADRIIVQPAYKNSLQWLLFRLFFWSRNYFDIIIEGVCEAHDIVECCHCRQLVNIYLTEKWKALPGKETHRCNVSGLSIQERYKKILELCRIDTAVSDFNYTSLCTPVPSEWQKDPYCLICPDSNDPRKCWEIEKFAEIISRIRQKSAIRIILIGCDSKRNQMIMEHCPNVADILDLSGKTDLFQLFTMIKNAGFMLSSDTGSAHAGVALHTPTYVICGKGEYGTFFPYPEENEGKKVFSIFSESSCRGCFWRDAECSTLPVYRCISEISTEKVWDCMMKNGIDSFLEENKEISGSCN